MDAGGGPSPHFRPAARINDATLGTAAVLLGGLWARMHGVPRSDALVEKAAVVLMGEAEEVPGGSRSGPAPRLLVGGPGPTSLLVTSGTCGTGR